MSHWEAQFRISIVKFGRNFGGTSSKPTKARRTHMWNGIIFTLAHAQRRFPADLYEAQRCEETQDFWYSVVARGILIPICAYQLTVLESMASLPRIRKKRVGGIGPRASVRFHEGKWMCCRRSGANVGPQLLSPCLRMRLSNLMCLTVF